MSILHGYGDMEPQLYWGHDLTFGGHVTSSVRWSVDAQSVRGSLFAT